MRHSYFSWATGGRGAAKSVLKLQQPSWKWERACTGKAQPQDGRWLLLFSTASPADIREASQYAGNGRKDLTGETGEAQGYHFLSTPLPREKEKSHCSSHVSLDWVAGRMCCGWSRCSGIRKSPFHRSLISLSISWGQNTQQPHRAVNQPGRCTGAHYPEQFKVLWQQRATHLYM